jgi:ribosomal protein S18 acetylase RimI-like enzyme
VSSSSGERSSALGRIRPAQLSDCAGLARVQVESYQEAYRGFFPPAYLAHFTREEQEQDWRAWLPAHPEEILLVAQTSSGEIAGYARGVVGPVYAGDPTPAGTLGDQPASTHAPASSPELLGEPAGTRIGPASGLEQPGDPPLSTIPPASALEPPLPYRFDSELAALHVRSAFQKQGIGGQLFAAAAAALHHQGCASMLLWVLAGNPARGFYERLGGVLCGEKRWQLAEFNGFEVVEVAYGWPDLTAL